METSHVARSLVILGVLVLAAAALEQFGTARGHGLSEILNIAAFAGYVSAIGLGSFRSPLSTLPVVAAAALLIPHQTCGMSISVLPGQSIMPAWILGSACHGIRRARRWFNGWKVGPPLDATIK